MWGFRCGFRIKCGMTHEVEVVRSIAVYVFGMGGRAVVRVCVIGSGMNRWEGLRLRRIERKPRNSDNFEQECPPGEAWGLNMGGSSGGIELIEPLILGVEGED